MESPPVVAVIEVGASANCLLMIRAWAQVSALDCLPFITVGQAAISFDFLQLTHANLMGIAGDIFLLN